MDGISLDIKQFAPTGPETYLPRPEPPIVQGIHLRHREIHNRLLECCIEVLPLNERQAISFIRRVYADS